MKLYNKFNIRIVFIREALSLCDKLKKALEQRKISDLEIVKKEKESHNELVLKCDSGASSLVNGTAFKWYPTDDPEDEITLNNFIDYLKDFPL